MLDDILASVRIGAAEVDTVIDTDELYPGGPLEGRVVIEGGETDQYIEELEHELYATAPDEGANFQVQLDEWELLHDFTVHEGERKEIPFQRTLPPSAPLTAGLNASDQRVKAWIDTALEIDRAIDDSDTDYLHIRPNPPIAAMLEAVEQAGFTLHRVTADTGRVNVNGRQSPIGYDQELNFRERGWNGQSFQEYQLHFLNWDDKGVTDVLIELEPYHRNVDLFYSMEIDHDHYSVDELEREFRQTIQNA